MIDPETKFALLCGGGVALSFALVGFALAEGPATRRYQRRLQGIGRRGRGGGDTSASAGVATRSLSRRGSATPRIDKLVGSWLPRRDNLLARIERTGRPITIGQYMMATVILTVLVTILVIGVLGVGVFPGLLAGLAVGALVPHEVVGRMGKRRIAAFINLFPEAIDLMVRALRSGLPISEALITAGNEIADPVGAEFRGLEAAMRMGRDLESLLWETAKRIDSPEFRFFIIALSVQRETGGNLAETLGNLADVLRRRRTMRAKARAMASEARASTMILGSLPVVVTLLLLLISPHYIATLFTDVRGLILCGIAVGMLAIGVFIMVKMARFEI